MLAAPVHLLLLVALNFAAQAPTRSVSGIVEDASGGAVPRASVTASCGATELTTYSDATGAFEIRALPAGACTMTARAEFFAPATVSVDLTRRANAFVRLVLAVAGIQAEVVVTPGRGEREQAFDVPEAVTVTTREELESRPYQILPQVLNEEPGVLVQQTTTAQGSPFIRGFSAQRLVYLLDGVRFNTSTFRAGATQYLGWIEPGLVERMEVVRGPASVQYGSDALGGTINVLSLKPPLSPAGTHVSGSVGGSVGTADLSVGTTTELLVQMPVFAFRAGGSARRVQDLRPGRGRDSHAAVTRFLGLPSRAIDTRLRETGFAQGGGYVAVQAKAGPSGTVHGLYLHGEQFGVTRYDRTLGGDGLNRSEFDPQRLDFALLRYERAKTGFLEGLTATLSINRQQDDRLEQARPTSPIERERGRVTAFGYQAQGTRQAGTSLFTFGGEVYDEYIGASREIDAPLTGSREAVRPEIPDGARYTSAGLFAQNVSAFFAGRLSVRTGLRYGHFVFRTTEQPRFGVDAERVATDALTFHTGVVVGLSPQVNLTATASRGFRAANAFDLGGIGLSGGGFEISPTRAAALGAAMGTTDGADAVGTGVAVEGLGPESVYAFEAGVKLRTERIGASINGFDFELVDAIQRRTAIFPASIVGTVVAGYEIIRRDEAGRAFVAADPRPVLTRVNVERARIVGLEVDGQVRVTPAVIASGYFAVANGHELATGTYLRRMPPPLGGARLKWEPTRQAFWIEGVATFARPQTRLSPGDLSDARIGARRSRSSIAAFFNGTAADLGLVRNGALVATGEALTDVQARILGATAAAPLFTRTPGFVAIGARAGWRFGPRFELTVIGENLTDANYRLHGSGVDAPGVSAQVRTRYRF